MELRPENTPENLVNDVVDEESFLIFLMALAVDAKPSEVIGSTSEYFAVPSDWEHGSIWAFLDAAAACGLDNKPVGGTRTGTKTERNPWRVCAEILLGGKYYE